MATPTTASQKGRESDGHDPQGRAPITGPPGSPRGLARFLTAVRRPCLRLGAISAATCGTRPPLRCSAQRYEVGQLGNRFHGLRVVRSPPLPLHLSQRSRCSGPESRPARRASLSRRASWPAGGARLPCHPQVRPRPTRTEKVLRSTPSQAPPESGPRPSLRSFWVSGTGAGHDHVSSARPPLAVHSSSPANRRPGRNPETRVACKSAYVEPIMALP
jgi:hypothetical protein